MTLTRTLAASAGTVLVAAFALVGCAPASPSVSSPAAAAGTWGVEAQGEPQLVLAEDGGLTGTDGCNRLMGSWTEDGATVEFHEVAMTQMYCERVDTWLSSLATATVDGTTLHVFDEAGVELGTLERG